MKISTGQFSHLWRSTNHYADIISVTYMMRLSVEVHISESLSSYWI